MKLQSLLARPEKKPESEEVSLILPVSVRDYLYQDGLILPPKLKAKDIPRLLYIPSAIVMKTFMKECKPTDFVDLSSEILVPIIGKNGGKYGAVTRFLKDHGIVEWNKYLRREKCRGYRLGPDFREQSYLKVPITGPRNFADRIWKGRVRADLRGLEIIGEQVAELVYRNTQLLTISDTKEARHRIVETCEPKGILFQEQALAALAKGEVLFFVLDCRGRIYSHFTNFGKEARHLIRLYGEPLKSADVKNSHPFLLSFSHPFPESAEAKRFLELTKTGKFYDGYLMDEEDLTDIDRDDVKEGMAGWIHGHPMQFIKVAALIDRILKRDFPSLHQWVIQSKGRTVSSGEYKRLGKHIMTLEARIVIGKSIARLIAIDPDFPVLTMHDELYTIPSQAEVVQDALNRSFLEELGHQPKSEIKWCRNAPERGQR